MVVCVKWARKRQAGWHRRKFPVPAKKFAGRFLFFMYRKTDLYYLIRFFMPFFFMGTIWLLRDKISRIDLLKKFGDQSFSIYIIHPLLCSMLYMVCQKYFGINLIYACIVQVVVFMISYYMAYLINKFTIIRKLFFPRSWVELKEVFKSK